MRRGLALALSLGLALLLTGGCPPATPPTTSPIPSPSPSPTSLPVGPRVGALAPDFQLPLLGGGTITLSELRGLPVLLNFWATWCGPCRSEMPYFEAAHKEFGGEGLVVLAVNVGEPEAIARAWMTSNGFTFMVALDSEREVAKQYRIFGLPTNFLIGRDGVIRFARPGAFTTKSSLFAALELIM
ncbi:MAG TPA: TlpA family protein disulfide reductase [Dehalococcoidia bacterium]|nr:TlpA family protein disulfide reductase [Dehalococcoidia bacterium]